MSDNTVTTNSNDSARNSGNSAPKSGNPLQNSEDNRTERSRTQVFFEELANSKASMSVFAVILALLFGGIMVAASNPKVHETSAYFFSRPMDMLTAIWEAAAGAFVALFRGAIYNFTAPTIEGAIRPITETLTFSTPLMIAGLALAISFQAGLFNIGGTGQVIAGVIGASLPALYLDFPIWVNLPIAVISGTLFGAFWGGLVGFLKARTGANEVIVTIMLNYVAIYFLGWMLTLDGYKRPGGNNPISPILSENNLYPKILGEGFRLHFGFILAIGLVFFTWWLMNRSTIGFQFRAVGFNQNAAKVAGMSLSKNFTLVMAASGALMGIAGTTLLLGTEKVVTEGIAGTYGFDAITVALLGRNNPFGVALAAILMGALKAGAGTMQAAEGVPPDIVAIVQSMIVLFIAAPPLVRSIFRLPTPKKED